MLTILSLISLVADVASADTLFSNFGIGHTYQCCTGWTLSTPDSGAQSSEAQYNAFSPTISAKLDQVTAGISWVSGTNEILLALFSDTGGRPGALMELWDVRDLPRFGIADDTPFTVDSASNPLLLTGQQYWLGATPKFGSDTWGSWNYNSIGQVGLVGFSPYDGGSFFSTTGSPGAFEITGTPVSTPEPGAYFLMAATLIFIFWLKTRRFI